MYTQTYRVIIMNNVLEYIICIHCLSLSSLYFHFILLYSEIPGKLRSTLKIADLLTNLFPSPGSRRAVLRSKVEIPIHTCNYADSQLAHRYKHFSSCNTHQMEIRELLTNSLSSKEHFTQICSIMTRTQECLIFLEIKAEGQVA